MVIILMNLSSSVTRIYGVFISTCMLADRISFAIYISFGVFQGSVS